MTLPASGGVLAVRTTAPPEDGMADDAVLRLLADALDQLVSSPELMRGATNRIKLTRFAP